MLTHVWFSIFFCVWGCAWDEEMKLWRCSLLRLPRGGSQGAETASKWRCISLQGMRTPRSPIRVIKHREQDRMQVYTFVITQMNVRQLSHKMLYWYILFLALSCACEDVAMYYYAGLYVLKYVLMHICKTLNRNNT